MTVDKIYLVGFMGAGKTTVGRVLSRRLGWRLLDVDELVEQREHMTVADLFAKRGEAYFRSVERTVLGDHLATRHAVVATGGGTFADAQNRALINQDGLSVWLDVSLERLTARVPADGRRPLAADRIEFERLYTLRRSAYSQAHLRIDATRASVEAIVEQLKPIREQELAAVKAGKSEAELQSLANSAAPLMTQLHVSRLVAHSKVYQVLTPEQRQKLEELRNAERDRMQDRRQLRRQ